MTRAANQESEFVEFRLCARNGIIINSFFGTDGRDYQLFVSQRIQEKGIIPPSAVQLGDGTEKIPRYAIEPIKIENRRFRIPKTDVLILNTIRKFHPMYAANELEANERNSGNNKKYQNKPQALFYEYNPDFENELRVNKAVEERRRANIVLRALENGILDDILTLGKIPISRKREIRVENGAWQTVYEALSIQEKNIAAMQKLEKHPQLTDWVIHKEEPQTGYVSLTLKGEYKREATVLQAIELNLIERDGISGVYRYNDELIARDLKTLINVCEPNGERGYMLAELNEKIKNVLYKDKNEVLENLYKKDNSDI